jgi:hypothetical protein
MPSLRTARIGKKIYSVDLMFSYINIFKPPITIMKMDDVKLDMDKKCWGDNGKSKISPNDVLKNPTKFKDDFERITKANLNYPIIMGENGKIYDGLHRIIKSKMLEKKTIKAYVFDEKLLNKFVVDRNGNNNCHFTKMDINEYIELFYKRFQKK